LVDWTTVYDVRHIPAVPIWYNAVFGIVFFGLLALFLLRPGTSSRTKGVGVGLLVAIVGLIGIGVMGSNYYGKLRADVISGHFVVLVGAVSDFHLEAAGRSSTFQFRIEGKPFILPEYFPAKCHLVNGTMAAVATEPSSEKQDVTGSMMWMKLPAGTCVLP
jgi:hypothetical protein